MAIKEKLSNLREKIDPIYGRKKREERYIAREEAEKRKEAEEEERRQRREQIEKNRAESYAEVEKISEDIEKYIYPSQIERFERKREGALEILGPYYGYSDLEDVEYYHIAKAIKLNADGADFSEVEKSLRDAARAYQRTHRQTPQMGGGPYDIEYCFRLVTSDYLDFSKTNRNIEKVFELREQDNLKKIEECKDDKEKSYVVYFSKEDIKKDKEKIEEYKERNNNLEAINDPVKRQKNIDRCAEVCAEGAEYVHPEALQAWQELGAKIASEMDQEYGILRLKEYEGIVTALKMQREGASIEELKDALRKANENVNQYCFCTWYHIDGEVSSMDKFLEFSPNGVEVYIEMVIKPKIGELEDCKKFGLWANEEKAQKQLEEYYDKAEAIKERNEKHPIQIKKTEKVNTREGGQEKDLD